MDEKKTKTLNVRISEDDHKKLSELIERTRQETNIKVTQAEMIAKLIRDASEK